MSPPELLELSSAGLLPIRVNCKRRLFVHPFPIRREVAKEKKGRTKTTAKASRPGCHPPGNDFGVARGKPRAVVFDFGGAAPFGFKGAGFDSSSKSLLSPLPPQSASIRILLSPFPA